MVYNRNAQKNPKEVTGIMNSMKMRYASVKDSKISADGSNDHEINMRYDEIKDGGMPQCKIVTNI